MTRTAPTRLIVARHGNTFGPGDVVTRVGRTDLPLVASGLEQGRLMGLYLAKAGLVPDLIYTSTLQRTIDTAAQAQAAMGTALMPETLSVFNEIDYGPDENKPEEEVVARLGAEAIARWDAEGIPPPGWRVDPAAIIAGWHAFAETLLSSHAGKTALVVTSNGIARFAPHLTGDATAFRARHGLKIATGAVCVFEYADGGWACTGWNLRPKDALAA